MSWTSRHSYFTHRIASEDVATTAGAHSPARQVFLRVGPKPVTDAALQRDFHETVDLARLHISSPLNHYLVQSGNIGRQTTMHAEDAAIHKRAHIQTVKYVHKLFPDVHCAKLSHTLVVETIHLRDLATLVIATKKRNAIGIAHLQCQKQQEGFHTVVSTIYVVTHKQVVCSGTVSSDGKQLLQIIELSVDITTNLKRKLTAKQ